MKKRVVVFGIFDGVHDGHRDFFRQAKEYGDELIVIVGRDASALDLKGKQPQHSEEERIELVKQEQFVDEAVLGDEEQSSYHVFDELKPDAVCFGYDQQELGEDLKKWLREKGKEIPVHFLKPYQSDSFHNSLL